MIELAAIGGYSEVGRNMTAINVDGEVLLLDGGLNMEKYIPFTEERENIERLQPKALIEAEALPDPALLGDWAGRVKAIVPSHAHLDHAGGIVFLERFFNAPIICTPFTAQVLRTISAEERIRLRNKIKPLNLGSRLRISDKLTLEFANATHSTPQTALVAIHTPQGRLVYANDYKVDMHPGIGRRFDYERMRQLGREGLLAVIMDSIYAREARKTPSEAVAREMLHDVLLDPQLEKKLIVVTTFASHIARLKSIVALGQQLGRNIIMLGRSLAKYAEAAASLGLVDFSGIEIIRYSAQAARRLKRLGAARKRTMLIVTGHQGEPRSILTKMATGSLKFSFESGEAVIFSCGVIPTATNRANRAALESKLAASSVRIFKDVHVSGHASREDMRDMLEMLRPKFVVPAHGDKALTSGLAELAAEIGWQRAAVPLLANGERLRLA